MQLYQNGRHEMLNEVNKDEVYRDLLDWLNKIQSANRQVNTNQMISA